ncbi:hydroxymethylbilane synthase [Robiginitalea sp. SC105]|uniref:hydroxymethylbilane synthase n=1 Tax=Robiginitalea sp. SC105 TaxID=2762332 RepID=UPI00163AA5A0|nr:hydroxymethylbilane synthase [Robiginitalea sp. SC105]MBC2838335.1 hydroxymethylbilane synthase [Robiginitalea sp. SC105]
MSRVLRIGTRDSELALWQARTVLRQLEAAGQAAELVPVKSTGDLILDKPLYELGITGIFTKTLDVALLRKDIDLAVHSMKDVPTALPQGISEAAVLQRASPRDVLIHKGLHFLGGAGRVATGSLRRKAQWLSRYPGHEVVGLRGNVNTRLRLLRENPWDGAIFAEAGLERLGLLPESCAVLDWMLPAPAQGAMLVVAREGDTEAREAAAPLNHPETALQVAVERAFLRTLEGGCTAPIGAQARLQDGELLLEGGLFSLDGSQAITVSRKTKPSEGARFGEACAGEILDSGGGALMESIRKSLAT